MAEPAIINSSKITPLATYSDESKTASNIQSYDKPEPLSNRHKQRVINKNKTTQPASLTSFTARSTTRQAENSAPLSYSQDTRNEQAVLSFASAPVTSYPQTTTASATNSGTVSHKTNAAPLVDQNVAISDGSEFLPDGSSQQDLFKSQSKNPRVYTIKDYQTADISCAPGYDDASSSHATLIRGLKGC
jgi:hypothetical protein